MAKRRNQPRQKSPRVWLPVVVIAAILLIGGGLAVIYAAGSEPAVTVNARPISAAQLAQGEQVYKANCASCHGLNGEGQPNWRQPDAEGAFPAPPHHNDGHTWHHADQQLLQIIARGGSMPNSNMPGYADTLTEDEMVAVLAYIKTFWGSRESDFQAEVTQNTLVQ
jgi:mono/diheme cytochrome c family protein